MSAAQLPASAFCSQVISEAGAQEQGPGRKMDTALQALQLPASARGPGGQVRCLAGHQRARGGLLSA